MRIDCIKPIPKYVIERIKKLDRQQYPTPYGGTRYYAYFTKNAGELTKVTVAVRHHYKRWLYKQVAVHGIHSQECFGKDMVFYYVAGYITGWFSEGCTKEPKWYESDEWDTADDKYFNPFAPIVNLEYATKQKAYLYSAIEQYSYHADLSYLRLYEQYPEMEYLVKLGLSCLAMSKIILRQCRKDKAFCKWLIRHKDEINNSHVHMNVIIRAYKTNANPQDTQIAENIKQEMRKLRDHSIIHELFPDRTIIKFREYLVAQKTNLNAYIDYAMACKVLHIDMKLNKNRFPKNFRYWHDLRIDQYQTKRLMADQQKRQELYTQFAKVAKKYLTLQRERQDQYVCLIAKSPHDLIREGEMLAHCFGRMNYDQRFVREESLIFFVREKDNPDQPFVTLEYSLSKHQVLQCYGYHDSKPSESVLHFVNKVWLPYANRKLKAIV